jgi:uncharacterized protein YgiM (DUF1202 family)
MRRILALALSLGCLLASPVLAETVRSTSRLNLREGPSLSSRRILVMSAGRDLLVLERRGDWLRVRVHDAEDARGAVDGWRLEPVGLGPTPHHGSRGSQPASRPSFLMRR